jgi:hypothetical protein
MSRTTVKPEESIWIPFETAWMARRGVASIN